MALKHPLADLQIDYSAFAKVSVHDQVVVLRQARRRIYTVLPRELVPEYSLDLLKAQISSQR